MKAKAEEEAKKVSGAAARRECERTAKYLIEALKLAGRTPTIVHVQEALRDWIGNNNTNRKTQVEGQNQSRVIPLGW